MVVVPLPSIALKSDLVDLIWVKIEQLNYLFLAPNLFKNRFQGLKRWNKWKFTYCKCPSYNIIHLLMLKPHWLTENWGAPGLSTNLEEVWLSIHTVCLWWSLISKCRVLSNPECYVFSQLHKWDGIKCFAKVDKEHSNVAVVLIPKIWRLSGEQWIWHPLYTLK